MKVFIQSDGEILTEYRMLGVEAAMTEGVEMDGTEIEDTLKRLREVCFRDTQNDDTAEHAFALCLHSWILEREKLLRERLDHHTDLQHATSSNQTQLRFWNTHQQIPKAHAHTIIATPKHTPSLLLSCYLCSE